MIVVRFLLMKVSELTGKPIPASLELERGRCMDLISDSHAWLHGKKFAIYGDPDFVMGMVKILLEVGAEPTHILSHNANKRWGKAVEKLLAASPFGTLGKVYVGNDLWHMRSLCFTAVPWHSDVENVLNADEQQRRKDHRPKRDKLQFTVFNGGGFGFARVPPLVQPSTLSLAR